MVAVGISCNETIDDAVVTEMESGTAIVSLLLCVLVCCGAPFCCGQKFEKKRTLKRYGQDDSAL